MSTAFAHFFTSSNETAHFASAKKRTLKRPKPIIVISGYAAFVVCIVFLGWFLIGSTKVF